MFGFPGQFLVYICSPGKAKDQLFIEFSTSSVKIMLKCIKANKYVLGRVSKDICLEISG